MDRTSRSHQLDFLLPEETPRDHETKKRINEMECHVFQGQRRGSGENRKRREQSVTHRHPRAVEISTTGARAHTQAPTPRFQGHVAARRRRVPETTRSREEGYHKLGNAMTTHRLGDTPRRFHDHLHARFDNTHTDRSTLSTNLEVAHNTMTLMHRRCVGQQSP